MIRKSRYAELYLEDVRTVVRCISGVITELEMPLIRIFILFHLWRVLFGRH